MALRDPPRKWAHFPDLGTPSEQRFSLSAGSAPLDAISNDSEMDGARVDGRGPR
jgi:hypothetical protein